MSKDVTALPLGWWHPEGCANDHDEGGNCLDHEGSIIGWRESVPADAILIDPTAPETVAALAAALEYEWELSEVWVDKNLLADGRFRGVSDEEQFRRFAAAILPAFVARLRETAR